MSVQELLKAVIEDMTQVQTIYYKKTETKQGPTLDILPEYSDFKHLFKKEANEDVLLLHQPQDYEINLKEGAVLKREPLQPMLAKKAEILYKYINDNLRKGLIQQLESLAGYPILIVYQNEKYYVYINYRGLNEITVKNSYPLPLIYKLQDCL